MNVKNSTETSACTDLGFYVLYIAVMFSQLIKNKMIIILKWLRFYLNTCLGNLQEEMGIDVDWLSFKHYISLFI